MVTGYEVLQQISPEVRDLAIQLMFDKWKPFQGLCEGLDVCVSPVGVKTGEEIQKLRDVPLVPAVLMDDRGMTVLNLFLNGANKPRIAAQNIEGFTSVDRLRGKIFEVMASLKRYVGPAIVPSDLQVYTYPLAECRSHKEMWKQAITKAKEMREAFSK